MFCSCRATITKQRLSEKKAQGDECAADQETPTDQLKTVQSYCPDEFAGGPSHPRKMHSVVYGCVWRRTVQLGMGVHGGSFTWMDCGWSVSTRTRTHTDDDVLVSDLIGARS